MVKKIDATLNGQASFSNITYFFRGTRYMRYDWSRMTVTSTSGHPLSAWNLPAPFSSGIDAAVSGRGEFAGLAYLFRGDKYITYDWKKDSVVGTAKSLSEWNLPAPFSSGVDAVVNGFGSYSDYCYFMKGNQYISYNWKTYGVGTPSDNISGWALPSGFRIEASASGRNSSRNKTYLFNGDKYVTYEWGAHKCSSSFSIETEWHLPAWFLNGSNPVSYGSTGARLDIDTLPEANKLKI